MKQKPSTSKRNGKPDPNRYPKGWDRRRVEALTKHYDQQTDDDAIAEAEAAYKDVATTMIQVPVELVAQVQRLISRRRPAPAAAPERSGARRSRRKAG
jgi:hypothetical protein